MYGMDVDFTRNIGLIAHIDAGKTTTTERILFYTGKSHKLGEVHEGTAVMDWMIQEQERGITIASASTTCNWKREGENYNINIIDTPGHIDFGIEVERSLRVLDGAIVVICGVAGVQPQTETVWQQSEKFLIPKLIFINKLDRIGADFFSIVEKIKTGLEINPVCINIPFYKDGFLCGVIDLIEMKTIIFDEESLGMEYHAISIPADYKQQAEKQRVKLLDSLSLLDDVILEKLLSEEQLSPKYLKTAISKATKKKKVVPVFCGASFKNKGVQTLLDGVVDFLPSPKEVDYATKEKKLDYEFSLKDNSPTIGLIFKTQKDKYSGIFSYLRIYQGTLEQGKTYYLNNSKKVKVGNIYRMHAFKKELIAKAKTGDIVAVILNQAYTGDTLAEKGVEILLEKIKKFQPVVSVVIEANSKNDIGILSQKLEIIQQEDPSLQVNIDSETGQLLLSGMGELHLEVVKDKLLTEHKLDINFGTPQVSYRESISKTTAAEVEFSKVLGNISVFAKCKLKIEENKEKDDFVFENEAQINHQKKQEILQSIKLTIEKASQSGVIGGYPIIRVKATLLEIKFAEVLQDFNAINICVSQAFRACLLKADSFLLSPVMKLNVFSPTEYIGDIIEDLNSKKSRIESLTEDKKNSTICVNAPLLNLFGYTTVLRSLSKGKAYHSAEFAFYERFASKNGGDNLH